MVYLVPVSIVYGVGDAGGDVSMTEIITQTNLTIFYLQREREREKGRGKEREEG